MQFVYLVYQNFINQHVHFLFIPLRKSKIVFQNRPIPNGNESYVCKSEANVTTVQNSDPTGGCCNSNHGSQTKGDNICLMLQN